MTNGEPFKICPACQARRPVAELSCENLVNGVPCGWDIVLEAIHEPGAGAGVEQPAPETRGVLLCRNGHPYSAGDLFCLICDDDLSSSESKTDHKPGDDQLDTGPTQGTGTRRIAGWEVVEERPTTFRNQQHFVVCRPNDAARFLLTLYRTGSEPDPAIYDLLRKFSLEHVPKLHETGHWEGQAYEVGELLSGGSVRELQIEGSDITTVERFVAELGQVLSDFSEAGLRHRDIRPETILIRTREPLDLVVSGFGSARLSDLDLEIAAPIETGRYTAPETVMGGISAASDWWGLGMVLLDKVTTGSCFAGADDQLFMIHVIAHGVTVPDGLHPRLTTLLRGLLTVDRMERWHWKQVQLWLRGEDVPVSSPVSVGTSSVGGPAIRLGGRDYFSVLQFSLAAARANAWNEACDLLERGAIAGWVRDLDLESRVLSALEQLTSRTDISSDFRLAVGLQLLNPTLPIICKEAIVSPAWLLANPESGFALLSGPVPELLLRFGLQSQAWLLQLAKRLESARRRAESLSIQLDESQFQFCSVVSSRVQLSAIWDERRQLFPDANLPALSSIIDRRNYSEEDLILLSSAGVGQFRSVDEVIAATLHLASERSLAAPEADLLHSLLQQPRFQLYQILERRTEGFARCEIALIDEWVDNFRIRRRLDVEQLLLVLAIREDLWIKPPHQGYLTSLLKHFEKKVSGSVLRGPLVKMTIGKTTPRIDITELGLELKDASSILERILAKSERQSVISPEIFENEPNPEHRLRRLENHSAAYQRDTGVNGLCLGFPFVVLNDQPTKRQPRLAPVLLWPVTLKSSVGRRDQFSVAFDSVRDEVRLNPAFDGLLGNERAKDWREAANSLMTQASIGISSALDAFGLLATVAGRELVQVPDKHAVEKIRHNTLLPAAVLFHVEFIGQSLVEDLRLLPQQTIEGTALETMLRIGAAPNERGLAPTNDLRFMVAASDPSQENAIAQAFGEKGVVIQGPPGTGKSQTIVNLVADAIGQHKSVLVVCQKLPALDVVRKRLEAHGLQDRICMVTNVNGDRENIMRDIRDQIAQLSNGQVSIDFGIPQRRSDLQKKILAIEEEVNDIFRAGQRQDSACGRSYASIVDELLSIELEHGTEIPDVTGLRKLLTHVSAVSLERLEESCADVGLLWLNSNFENNPYRQLQDVPHDDASISEFRTSLESLHSAVEARCQILKETPNAIDVDNPDDAENWINDNEAFFKSFSAEDFNNLQAKVDCFGDDSGGSQLIQSLRDMKELYRSNSQACEKVATLRSVLQSCPEDRIREYAEYCGQISTHWLNSRFNDNPLRQMKDEAFDAASIAAFRDCLQHLATVEKQRQAVLQQPFKGKDLAETSELEQWLEQYGEMLRNIEVETATTIRILYSLFESPPNRTSRGEVLLAKAREFSNRLTSLNLSGYSASIGRLVYQVSSSELLYWKTAAEYLVGKTSLIDEVNVDEATVIEFGSRLASLHSAEEARCRGIQETLYPSDADNPDNAGTQVNGNKDFLTSLPENAFVSLLPKIECFRDESAGSELIQAIRDLKELYGAQHHACEEIPSLRSVLSSCSEDRIREYAEHCGRISTHWLASRFNDSPLHQLKDEEFDGASIATFRDCLQHLAAVENHRQSVFQQPFKGKDLADTSELEQWLERYGETLLNIDAATATRIRDLYSLFDAPAMRLSKGSALLAQANDFSCRLKGLDLSRYSSSIGRLVSRSSGSELLYWQTVAGYLVKKPSLIDRVNPVRLLAIRRARQFLSVSSIPPNRTNIEAFGETVLLEFQIMDIRHDWQSFADPDTTEQSEIVSLIELRENIESARRDLEVTHQAFTALKTCPLKIRIDVERLNKPVSFHSLMRMAELFVRRAHARTQSLEAVEAVRPWMSEEWCQKAVDIVSGTTHCLPDQLCPIATVCECISTLDSFCEFRNELRNADPVIHKIFEALSSVQGRIKELAKTSPPSQLIRAYVFFNGLNNQIERSKRRMPAIASFLTGTEKEVVSSLHSLVQIEQAAKISKNVDPARLLALWRARQLLSLSSIPPNSTNIRSVGEALLLELQVTDIRKTWRPLPDRDITKQAEVMSLIELKENIEDAKNHLDATHQAFIALQTCPLKIRIDVEKLNNPGSFHSLVRLAELLIRRANARTQSLEAIEAARPWMSVEWCRQAVEKISRMAIDEPQDKCPVQAIVRALPTVESFVAFRTAVRQSGSVVPRLFDALSTLRERIEELVDSSSPDQIVRAYVLFNGLAHQIERSKRKMSAIAGFLSSNEEELASSLRSLERLEDIAKRLNSCPCAEADRVDFVSDATLMQNFFASMKEGISRGKVLRQCRALLKEFSKWVSDTWTTKLSQHIESNSLSPRITKELKDALPSLKDFLVFRRRESGFSKEQQQCFTELAKVRNFLCGGGTELAGSRIKTVIRREGLLAWKALLESQLPQLLTKKPEFDRKIDSLRLSLQRLKEIDQKLLTNNFAVGQISPATRWEGITRLRGPRRVSLREFFQSGTPLGLRWLRPVWLMIPNVVSQVLPRVAGLFDIVVFDEASQMPVEHSLPSLFRARTVVVSGDEKQMPPSSFFSSRMESDETDDEDDNLSDDELTEQERDAQEEAWNRREIKDCPDLLHLAESILPRTMLQIHYRSRYRELISFSNAAYYRNELSVPVIHPDKTILADKPLEYIPVKGVYEKQTNEIEAKKVIAYLESIWSESVKDRPSIGVVTFNRKQADLIEDLLESRAEKSAKFRDALIMERSRRDNGEDMSFFVKNVENVQGDERDLIVFSTTFGKSRQGTFRRNFGVLGQSGGERRLNVAITRARTRVALVTSMPVQDVSDMLNVQRAPVSPRDYLQGYLEYARLISSGAFEEGRRLASRMNAGRRSEYDVLKPLNGFQKSVSAFLSSLGYEICRPEPDPVLGIDFAIIDPHTRLFGVGIECDLPTHKLLSTARAREIWRPSVIGATYRAFVRVSGSDWLQDRTSEQQRILREIRSVIGENP